MVDYKKHQRKKERKTMDDLREEVTFGEYKIILSTVDLRTRTDREKQNVRAMPIAEELKEFKGFETAIIYEVRPDFHFTLHLERNKGIKNARERHYYILSKLISGEFDIDEEVDFTKFKDFVYNEERITKLDFSKNPIVSFITFIEKKRI